ncbi:MAG: LysE family translocator [Sulfitobacter sp.]
MTLDILIAFVLFAFVSSATPGPNNLMLMASGANFGFRRTIPHMAGISVGMMVLICVVGGGLARIFDLYPVAHIVLKALSVGYMTFLAWKIATAAPLRKTAASQNPMTFLQAAAFQWVNPKAWAMALTSVTVYVANGSWGVLFLACCVFALVNFPSVTIWTAMGQQMAKFLHNPRRLRLFNLIMAALLMASLYPVLAMQP